MERVEGEPLTDYCRTHGLSLDDRVRLFASCCDAVDAAHRALVVHRDLKPARMTSSRRPRYRKPRSSPSKVSSRPDR